MINVAYLDPRASIDPASPTVEAFHEATVQWNNAIYGALLIAPPAVATEIPKLDREVDRLLDLAVARRWTRAEFRRERVLLGRMAAEYLKVARRLAGLSEIDLSSIWTWDGGDNASQDSSVIAPTELSG
jgi:hypothetical protein